MLTEWFSSLVQKACMRRRAYAHAHAHTRGVLGLRGVRGAEHGIINRCPFSYLSHLGRGPQA